MTLFRNVYEYLSLLFCEPRKCSRFLEHTYFIYLCRFNIHEHSWIVHDTQPYGPGFVVCVFDVYFCFFVSFEFSDFWKVSCTAIHAREVGFASISRWQDFRFLRKLFASNSLFKPHISEKSIDPFNAIWPIQLKLFTLDRNAWMYINGYCFKKHDTLFSYNKAQNIQHLWHFHQLHVTESLFYRSRKPFHIRTTHMCWIEKWRVEYSAELNEVESNRRQGLLSNNSVINFVSHCAARVFHSQLRIQMEYSNSRQPKPWARILLNFSFSVEWKRKC